MNILRCVSASFLFLGLISRGLAQGTLEAVSLPTTQGPYLLLNDPIKGVGWSFVPTVNIQISELGMANLGQTLEVTLWTDSLQPLASEIISTSEFDEFGKFQPISNVLLIAGNRYFVSSQTSPSTPIGGIATEVSSGPAHISPYLAGFANYSIRLDNTWNPSQPVYGDILFFGPTFRFQVVPEPGTLALWITAGGGIVLARRGRTRR